MCFLHVFVELSKATVPFMGHDEFFKFQFDVIILSPAHQGCIPSGDQGHAESHPSVLTKVIENNRKHTY